MLCACRDCTDMTGSMLAQGILTTGPGQIMAIKTSWHNSVTGVLPVVQENWTLSCGEL